MLVSADGRLKVTDFGIARALSTMTPGEHTDVVWGSPLYFSPEQARGEALTPASDVYSIGIVMYELLSGTPPFTASTPDELARLHISARPIPIREYVPDIPVALEEIIMKVLSKEPSARYRTADQLGRVLLKFGTLPDAPIPVPPSRPVSEPVKEKPQPPRAAPAPVQYAQPEPAPRYIPQPEPPAEAEETAYEAIDWATVGLSLLALLAVGGLIPLWMMVYFAYTQ
jgi:serine/threonine-protein kinase